MDSGEVKIEGLAEVLKAIQTHRVEVNRAAAEGLKTVGMNIVADAQVNLRKNKSVVTGLLRQSGRVIDAGDEGVDAGFFNKGGNADGYAEYVEYGRRAGRMPPPSALEEWLYKKHRMERKAARPMAWAMAVKIMRKGTKPHPFFEPALKKWQQRAIDVVTKAVRKVVG